MGAIRPSRGTGSVLSHFTTESFLERIAWGLSLVINYCCISIRHPGRLRPSAELLNLLPLQQGLIFISYSKILLGLLSCHTPPMVCFSYRSAGM